MHIPSAKQIMTCFYKGLVNMINHEGVEHAGYLAFLGLLALFPFLVFFVSVIGIIGQGDVGTEFIQNVLVQLPENITEALRPRILEIISGPPQGLLTLSVLGAVWTASSAVEGIRTILNRAYHVEAQPAYWMRRGLSILQLLSFTLLVVSAMLMVVWVQVFLRKLGNYLGVDVPADVLDSLSKMVFIVLGFVLLAAVTATYYLIPNIRQPFFSLVPGAIIVVIGWFACAYGFTYYLNNYNNMNLIYGSLGSMIAALIFLYICNMVFIYGAEFNYLLSLAIGVRVAPDTEARRSSDQVTPL